MMSSVTVSIGAKVIPWRATLEWHCLDSAPPLRPLWWMGLGLGYERKGNIGVASVQVWVPSLEKLDGMNESVEVFHLLQYTLLFQGVYPPSCALSG